MAADESHDDRTQSFVALTAGTAVSHYKIVEKIGSGGMGEVYLAEDTELNRKVALKFLPPHLCQDEDCRKRFKREAQAAAGLDHPNIAGIYEVGEHQGRPFYSMQIVEGQSLKDVISGKDLPIERILEIAIQVCEGLQAAHDKGIIHRDIKPSNILLDSYGRVRIVDFGLAAIRGSEHLTKTGSTLGTIGYMSPEQVQGKESDHRSDLFSLGVVLYELITKQDPFKRNSEAATLKAVIDDLVEPVARFKSGLPDGLQALVDKTLEKDVKMRYQHADDMLSDLMRLKRSLESTRITTTSIASEKKSSRLRWIAAVFVVLIVVVTLITKPWVTKPASDKLDKIMLAVLPFENLGSPDDEYFADGMTEEITTSLASLSGLGVISRTSSMQYKKTEKSLRQIGKELNVDYVLEGTIRWEKTGSESRVRINPQLIRVSDDSHVWANRFDAVLTNVFQVQSTIAHEVATALDVTLLQSEQEVLSRKPHVDSRAYDYYLRGKQYFAIAHYQQQELYLAEKMHLKAIELAPDFPQAYAELGILYTEMHWEQTDPSLQKLDSAKKMIDMAMRLAPDIVETHEALGWYYYHGLRDFNHALEEFSKVLALQPNNVPALASTAWVHRRQGKWQEAITGLELVNKLDPRDPWYKYELGITYHYCHRYQDAIAQFDQVIDLQPNLTWAYILKSWALFNEIGKTREARAVLDAGRACNGRWPELTWLEAYYDLCDGDHNHALNLMTAPGDVLFPEDPDTSDYYSLKGHTYRLMGQPQVAKVYFDSARVRLERALLAAPNSAPRLSSLANVYAGLGRVDEALSMARRATELDPVSADALDGPKYVRALAMVYAQVGQKDQAVELVDYLLSIPSNMSVNVLKLMPEFQPLRGNPSFQALLNKHENEHGI